MDLTTNPAAPQPSDREDVEGLDKAWPRVRYVEYCKCGNRYEASVDDAAVFAVWQSAHRGRGHGQPSSERLEEIIHGACGAPCDHVEAIQAAERERDEARAKVARLASVLRDVGHIAARKEGEA